MTKIFRSEYPSSWSGAYDDERPWLPSAAADDDPSRFCVKPEDVDCRYCLHTAADPVKVRTCPYIAEQLKSGAIEYLDLILEYFGHIPHAGLHKRIQAVEHWSGPDQAVPAHSVRPPQKPLCGQGMG